MSSQSNHNEESHSPIEFPISQFRIIEPILIKHFGYNRGMFSHEFFIAFNSYYPNGEESIPNKEQYMIDLPQLNEYAFDEGVFDYKRYAPRESNTIKGFDTVGYMMNSDHNITFITSNSQLVQQIQNLLVKHKEEDTNNIIGSILLIVAIIYEIYERDKLYTDVTWSEDTLPYLTKVRPEMLKLYELLRSGITFKDNTIRPITIDNGKQKVTLNNSFFWLTDLLDEYLQIYLGVDSLEEAQKELSEIYATKKGRKPNVPFNNILYGTYKLLQEYSILPNQTSQFNLISDYLNLLGLLKGGSTNQKSGMDEISHITAYIHNLLDANYTPKWKPKQMEDYKLSPNNPTIDHFW